MKLKFNVLILFIATAMLSSCKDNGDSTATTGDLMDKEYFTMENGELIRPKGYRSWIYVGTPVTPNDLNGGKAAFPEMHNVYIDPASYEVYKKTGVFKEGTILMKELVSVGATAAVSGKGYFEGEFIGLEASVKSKEHFPNEPGNWAIFSFTQPKIGTLKDKAKPFPYDSCAACHDVNAQDDFVFTQYYPVLRAAKGAGDFNPEDAAKREASDKAKDDKKVGIWDATAPTPKDTKFDIPIDEAGLFAYLNTGKYKDLKNKEGEEPHKSAGPHEYVRSFISDKLAASVKAGNAEHPMGSYAIKEQYKDGKQLGWAVMVKTQKTSERGNGWFWYEVLDRTDISKKAAYGNGVKGCVSCHTIGNDMVRAEFL
ncbi:MAG: hypothetical protein ACJAR4_001884 [Psychroserpens sp.]|jgi:hypothetical protein